MAEWRSERTPAYNKWLYERRKLRFENAERFEQAIRDALATRELLDAQLTLRFALDAAEAAEREIGNRFDHSLNESYYSEEEDD